MSIPVDVAVIGCGPVGAFAANLLGKLGLRAVVVERDREPYSLPRAVHVDHEMLRLFADVDLLEAVEPRMVAADGHLHIGADGGVIRFLSAAGAPRPFTFANDYFFYQPELEAALRAGVRRFPHLELRFGTALIDLWQDDDGVTLQLDSGETVRARYVIGCDGARSAVRKALGIRLDDLSFEEPWLVVDAEVDGPISFPQFAGVPDGADLQRLSVMLCDPRRPATIVPGRGKHRRWEFMLVPGESDVDMMQPHVVEALIAPWVKGVTHRIVRAATYHFHGLVAEDWRFGRVFLAGDAAHQTPPFFGQGMCHGLRDVANLAWKLELVLSDTADAKLLDSYQRERDPHVRAIIGAAVEAGRYICELDPERAAARDTRLRSQSGPRTAADLIPPICDGIVEQGSGARFIQPMLIRPEGCVVRLDEISGGGWTLVLSEGSDVTLSPGAAAVWGRLEGTTIMLGKDCTDAEGHLTRWLAQHNAIGVIVRPDFYCYASAADATALSGAIERLGSALCLRPVVLSPTEDIHRRIVA